LHRNDMTTSKSFARVVTGLLEALTLYSIYRSLKFM
jgi:hypothetical protein